MKHFSKTLTVQIFAKVFETTYNFQRKLRCFGEAKRKHLHDRSMLHRFFDRRKNIARNNEFWKRVVFHSHSLLVNRTKLRSMCRKYIFCFFLKRTCKIYDRELQMRLERTIWRRFNSVECRRRMTNKRRHIANKVQYFLDKCEKLGIKVYVYKGPSTKLHTFCSIMFTNVSSWFHLTRVILITKKLYKHNAAKHSKYTFLSFTTLYDFEGHCTRHEWICFNACIYAILKNMPFSIRKIEGHLCSSKNNALITF